MLHLGNEAQIVSGINTPTVPEAVKSATAQKNGEEILTKHAELKGEIDIQLQERLADYGLAVDVS
ncbi:MAG TPA: hypothetical protein V6D03_04135 [Candidatus Caenarcaniphilales bacterium]